MVFGIGILFTKPQNLFMGYMAGGLPTASLFNITVALYHNIFHQLFVYNNRRFCAAIISHNIEA